MKTNLCGKIAIVTGSSRGIGKALATALVASGVKVVLNARTPEPLAKTLQELQEKGGDVHAVEGDVSNFENCRRLVEEAEKRFGKIDILVNNAGVAVSPSLMMEIQPEVFRRVMEVNFLSAVYMTRAALPSIERSRGSVLFVSSLAGLCGFAEGAAYSPAKMALTAFAETLRLEWSGKDVHVGIAYLGFTENEPGKTMLGPDGQIVIKNHTYAAVRLEPLEKVAARLLKMLERRQFKAYFTAAGKLLALLNRFFPAMLRYLLLIGYRRKLKTGRPAI